MVVYQKQKHKTSKLSLSDKRNMIGYIFILPFLLGLALLFLPALFDSVIHSLSKVTVGFSTLEVEGIGFKNYSSIFTEDVNFIPMLFTTTKGMLLDLMTIVFFSFFIANVLNQKFHGRGFCRTIFFLPVVLATGIIAAADTNNMVSSVFGSSANTGSTLPSAFGDSGMALFNLQELLTSASMSKGVSSFLVTTINNTYSVVNSSGVQILIFLSALQSISPSLFEAAKVEGATKWEEFWKITFPMLTPMILVNIVYTVVDSFSNSKYTILSYIKNTAFANNDVGYASAMSWIYFITAILILGLIWGLLKKRIQYLD